MSQGSYKQFCPVAMAAEVLCTRWTVVLLREMVVGSTRFNDLRRGVPQMSPALLSKRLKDLEEASIVRRVASQTDPGARISPDPFGAGSRGGDHEHRQMGPALGGDAGVPCESRSVPADVGHAPQSRSDPDAGSWLVVDSEAEVDLCSVDPGFEVDLYVTVDLRTMTAIWMGLTNVRESAASGKLVLSGDRGLAGRMQAWLGLSPFAAEKKLATA